MTTRIGVQVPPGLSSGQSIQFQTPSGMMMQAQIPAGVSAGQTFYVDVPNAAPVAVAQAVPMGGGVPMGGAVPMGSAVDGGGSSVPMGMPMVSSQVSSERGVAEAHAECPICFESLHKAPVGVFLDGRGKRVSQHFFNLEAARQWLSTGNGHCPLTRQPIASVLPVPDLRTDPEGWFRAVDVDGNGKLSRKEVVEALKAQLRVDNKALDAAIADPHGGFWRQWDKDGSGTIEKEELLAPQGLAHYVRSTFLKRQDTLLIPDIKRDKNAWYAYWDEDGSGTLEKEEVVRALLKTLNLQSTPAKVLEMRGTIDAIWPVFDPDGSNSIDKAEFLAAEGLANTIIATVS